MASGFFLFFKTYLPKKLFSEDTKPTQNVVVDSLMIEALQREDSLKLLGNKPKVEGEMVSDEPEYAFKGMVYLDAFFEVLHQLETKQQGKARIAYFGDSMTDGDLIVQDLRKNLQEKYGGTGVGFVGVTSESSSSRGSVAHTYSNNWKTQSYLNVKRPLKPFGVNGQVFFVKDSLQPTWVQLKAGPYQTMNRLPNPVLYYGQSNNQGATVSWITGKDTIVKPLKPTRRLNTLRISEGSIKELKLNFNQADSIPIYGVDLSAKTSGVQVDNFSSRGNSGLPLSLLQPALMNQFQKELGYNLIILHYGTNVLNYGSYNYGWYTKQMSKVVEHLRTCFPEAAILVVSTADKATKYELHMQTDSAVMPLMKAQRKYAMEKHTGFFNLFESMGGENAMVTWVETEPAKANKDYTHFNHRGAQQVGRMLFDYLEQGLEDYKERKKNGGVIKREVKPAIALTTEEPVVHPKSRDTVTKTVVTGSAVSTSKPTTQPTESTKEVLKPVIEQLPKTTEVKTKVVEPQSALEGQVHLVKEGETLYSIAKKYHTTAGKLKKYNNLERKEVQIGQQLYIPFSKNSDLNRETPKVKTEPTMLYEVEEGDTLTSLARKFNTTVQRLKELNNLGNDGIEIEQIIIVPNESK